MRFSLVVAGALALTACGGGDAEQFAAGNSALSEAQIDAALGPADQSTVEDAVPVTVENTGNGDAPDANSESPSDEDEE